MKRQPEGEWPSRFYTCTRYRYDQATEQWGAGLEVSRMLSNSDNRNRIIFGFLETIHESWSLWANDMLKRQWEQDIALTAQFHGVTKESLVAFEQYRVPGDEWVILAPFLFHITPDGEKTDSDAPPQKETDERRNHPADPAR